MGLIDIGVSRKTMVSWAVETGYSQTYIRSLLSKILRGLGQGERKPGAGRRVPQEALILRAIARNNFGQKAAKYLLAAYRLEKSETDAHRANNEMIA